MNTIGYFVQQNENEALHLSEKEKRFMEIVYSFKGLYSAKATSRQYFKKNDTTVLMFEVVDRIAEKGMKSNPALGNTQLTVDSICYSIYVRR